MPSKKYKFVSDTSFSWKDAFPRTSKKATFFTLEDVDLPLDASDYRILCTCQKVKSLVLTADTGSGFKEIFKPDFTDTGVVSMPQVYDVEEQDEALSSLVSKVPYIELVHAWSKVTRKYVKIMKKGYPEPEVWEFED